MPSVHQPVLCDRVVEWLRPTAPGLLVDATVGLGGHAAALLAAEPGFRLLGIDRDPEALAAAQRNLQTFADRSRLVCGRFGDLPGILELHADLQPVAVLADLGCSSLQLDSPRRGFSFQHDGPLDMRMGDDGPTAADIVNRASEQELASILLRFGEERRARAVARKLVARRDVSPFRTTGELSRLVVEVVGSAEAHRLHPATRTFQALRIAVNNELDQLEEFLEPAARALQPAGRIAVLAFHSLEDRIVKHTLRRLEGRCVCPPELPECRCHPDRVVRLLTRRAERPDDREIAVNPRARSARLRVAERLEVLA